MIVLNYRMLSMVHKHVFLRGQ